MIKTFILLFSFWFVSVALIIIMCLYYVKKHETRPKATQTLYIFKNKVITKEQAENYELLSYKFEDNILYLYFGIK